MGIAAELKNKLHYFWVIPSFQDFLSLNHWLSRFLFFSLSVAENSEKIFRQFCLYNGAVLLSAARSAATTPRWYLNSLLFAALFTAVTSSYVAKNCWRGWFLPASSSCVRQKLIIVQPSINPMVFNSVLFCRLHSSSTAVMLDPQPTSLPPLLSPIKASLLAAPLK